MFADWPILSLTIWLPIIGGILGAIIIVKTGINKALWLFGVVQILTILGFAWLSNVGADVTVLAVVIAAEYLGVGLGNGGHTFAPERQPLGAAIPGKPCVVQHHGYVWMVEHHPGGFLEVPTGNAQVP